MLAAIQACFHPMIKCIIKFLWTGNFVRKLILKKKQFTNICKLYKLYYMKVLLNIGFIWMVGLQTLTVRIAQLRSSNNFVEGKIHCQLLLILHEIVKYCPQNNILAIFHSSPILVLWKMGSQKINRVLNKGA